MALPEGRKLDRPEIHVDDLGDQRVVERVSRSGWRWWWVFPVVLALAFWWAGWGWWGTGGWWWGNGYSVPGARSTANLQRQIMSGPGVQILNAPSKDSFIGKQFAANDIPIERKPGDRALWIGEGKEPMLAVVTGATKGVIGGLAPGEIVSVLGTVQKAPPQAQAQRDWNLSDQGAMRLEQEGAYIQVSRLTVPRQ